MQEVYLYVNESQNFMSVLKNMLGLGTSFLLDARVVRMLWLWVCAVLALCAVVRNPSLTP